MRSGSGRKQLAPDFGMSWVSRLLHAGAVLWLAQAGVAYGQAAPPPSGQILQGIERSLPNRQPGNQQAPVIEVQKAPAASANTAARVTVKAYRISGNTVFAEKTLLRLVESHTGELSLNDLYAVADILTRYYRTRGFLVARAYLPQQEIKDGIITLAILEDHYDQIGTHSSARVSDDRVLRTIGSAVCSDGTECKGALIVADKLERGLLILNDTPGVHASARLSPGGETGTSNLDVNATAEPLLSGMVTLDNEGDYYTGNARAIANVWLNSPLGYGDQLSLQTVESVIHGSLAYGAVGYSVPFGYDGLRLSARGWNLGYHLGGTYSPLGEQGTAYGGDITLSYPFIRSQSANLYGSLDYGDRRFHDSSTAIGLSDRRGISNRVETALNGDLQDDFLGAPAFTNYTLSYAHGTLGLDATLAATDVLTARTAGGYDKEIVTLTRLQSVFDRSALYVKVTGQNASKNLDAYEKFSLGGPDAVRAYPTEDGLVDEAVLYSVEWRQRFDNIVPRTLEAVLFYDHGTGHINTRPWQAGPNSVTLDGVGGGLNIPLSGRVLLKSFIAFRGDRPFTAAPDHPVQYGLQLSTVF